MNSDLIARLRKVRGSFVIPIEAPDVFGWADEAAAALEKTDAELERKKDFRIHVKAWNQAQERIILLERLLAEGVRRVDPINKTVIEEAATDCWLQRARQALEGNDDEN